MAGPCTRQSMWCNLPEVGGLHNLLAHPQRARATVHVAGFFAAPITRWRCSSCRWPSSGGLCGIPGSEPGGGGYVAQRMLAAKSERDAIACRVVVQHHALRTAPLALVARRPGVVELSIRTLTRWCGPSRTSILRIVKNDLAYPAMLTSLPAGWLGLVVASLIAAYMSTISTHLNWGSSYIVNDFYRRFVNPDASQKELGPCRARCRYSC